MVAYVRGSDGRLWAADRGGPAAANWSPWQQLPALPDGRRVASEPGAAANEDAVYVLDGHGVAWRRAAGWSRVGAGLLSAPASVAQLIRGTLTTSLFGRRADGRLYYRTPSGWVPLGRI